MHIRPPEQPTPAAPVEPPRCHECGRETEWRECACDGGYLLRTASFAEQCKTCKGKGRLWVCPRQVEHDERERTRR